MRFLADENFNNEIIRGIERRVPGVDVTRIQDTELAGEPDPLVLEWAVQHNFIVLTHDINTMRGYYYERVNAELPVPGLFLVHGTTPVGEVIEALELIVLASEADEWQGEIEGNYSRSTRAALQLPADCGGGGAARDAGGTDIERWIGSANLPSVRAPYRSHDYQPNLSSPSFGQQIFNLVEVPIASDNSQSVL